MLGTGPLGWILETWQQAGYSNAVSVAGSAPNRPRKRRRTGTECLAAFRAGHKALFTLSLSIQRWNGRQEPLAHRRFDLSFWLDVEPVVPFRMLPAFIDRHQTAKIVLLQTTYMHLAVENGLFQVDYKDKAAYQLKLGTQGALAHYTRHPLLLPHNEARTTLYLNSRPANPQALLEDIERAIDSVFRGWSDWRSLFFGAGNYKAPAVALARQNITQGSGILLDYAPATIIRVVTAACEKHGVATKYFGSLDATPSPRGTFSILFVGACYVIARDFRIHALPKTKEV